MERRSAIPHLLPAALTTTKQIEIQLAWYLNDYKVIAISNSTILKPGEWLSVEAVDQLCAEPGWTVKMADNEAIQTLFGLGAGVLDAAAKA